MKELIYLAFSTFFLIGVYISMEKKTKTKMLKQLEILATVPATMKEPIPLPEEDEPLQASKEIPKEPCELPKKPKRVPNEAQLEGMKKGREALAQRNAERKAQRLAEEAERKRQLEEKVVSKAISIKKKQLKQEIALDEISDDETPIEEIKQKVVAKKQAPPTPRTQTPVPKVQPQVSAPPIIPVKPKPAFYFV
jgi:hypothetical protein